MRFFIPEWDDHVDPGYDFLTDTHSADHDEDPQKNDAYMWEIFGIEKVPFDGVLVSIATIPENSKKNLVLQQDGVHNFLRLPNDFKIIGDCGAFTYKGQTIPPYKTSPVLKQYSDLGFNFGVSIDHLILPKYREQNKNRIKITYDNGIEAFKEWKKKYKNDFQLIVAVQGAEISDYINMFDDYYQHGIRNFAFGSLVKAPTFFIVKLIDALIADIKKNKKTPEYIHFFGVARCSLFQKFKEVEQLGVEVSFDSSSYLRKAWLTSAHTQFNYIDQSWEGYSAIRIPPKLKKSKEIPITPEDYNILSRKCLDSLRNYDNNQLSLEEITHKLKIFNEVLQEDPELLIYYQRTLKSKPWKQCPCPICKKNGIDVAIFRGNNRNRRRGFHNVFVFYEILKNEQLWERCKKKEIKKRMKARERTSLEFLKDKKDVLILTSCTKNKINCDDFQKTEAREMYQGTLFKKVKTYAETMNFDYKIISAQYGLLEPNDPIMKYNKRLRTNGDVESIRPEVEEKLVNQLSPYKTIVVIAGEKYRDVLFNLFFDERFVFIKARGIGDMISIVSKAISKNKNLNQF